MQDTAACDAAAGEPWSILQWLVRVAVHATKHAIRQEHKAAAMRALALTDELTGLYNRRGFSALARKQLRLGERTGRRMALFVADVNRMKVINDTLGHHAGDRVLKRVASLLHGTFRESDIVARCGGDEFIALAVDTNEGSEEIIRARLEHGIRLHNQGREIPISLSVGVAAFEPGRSLSLEALTREADRTMYSHKHARSWPRIARTE